MEQDNRRYRDDAALNDAYLKPTQTDADYFGPAAYFALALAISDALRSEGKEMGQVEARLEACRANTRLDTMSEDERGIALMYVNRINVAGLHAFSIVPRRKGRPEVRDDGERYCPGPDVRFDVDEASEGVLLEALLRSIETLGDATRAGANASIDAMGETPPDVLATMAALGINTAHEEVLRRTSARKGMEIVALTSGASLEPEQIAGMIASVTNEHGETTAGTLARIVAGAAEQARAEMDAEGNPQRIEKGRNANIEKFIERTMELASAHRETQGLRVEVWTLVIAHTLNRIESEGRDNPDSRE